MKYFLVFIVIAVSALVLVRKTGNTNGRALSTLSSWSVATSEMNGKPIISRYLSGVDVAADRSKYPFQIGVAVPLLKPEEHGFPDDKESEELSTLEDAISDKFSRGISSPIQVMVLSYNGMREFVYYAPAWTPEEYEKEIKTINAKPHELQFMMQEDREWDTYKMHSARN